MNTHPHPLRSTDRPTDRRRCVGVSPCVCGAWPFWSGLTAGRKRWRRRAQPCVCGRARRSVCRVVSASSSVDGPGGLDRRDRNAPQEKRAGGERAARAGARTHVCARRTARRGVCRGLCGRQLPASAGSRARERDAHALARAWLCLPLLLRRLPPPRRLPARPPPAQFAAPRGCAAHGARAPPNCSAAAAGRSHCAPPLARSGRARLALACFGPSPSPSHRRSASGHRGSSLLHAAAEDGALDRDVPLQPLAFASRTRGVGVGARQRHPKAVDAWHCHAPVDAPPSPGSLYRARFS